MINPSIIDEGFRRRAWIKVAIGVIGFVLMLGLFFLIGMAADYAPVNPFKMIPPSIPFVYLCIGLIEVVSGKPYRHLAAEWMNLKGWQRAIIGTIIVIVALAFILLGVAFVFTYLIR
jgi:hypothetical protein